MGTWNKVHCNDCSQTFNSVGAFDFHRKAFDGKPKKCNDCSFKACTSGGLKAHKKQVHG